MDTINIAPTWAGQVNVLLALHDSGTKKARDFAAGEFSRMAILADQLVELVEDKPDPKPGPAVDLAYYCGVRGDERTILGYFMSSLTDDIVRAGKYPELVTHNTVLGYLALHHPERLAYMDDHADATQRDGFWLGHRARERKLIVITVTAPPVLVEQGITTVRAWPIELLAERFNP